MLLLQVIDALSSENIKDDIMEAVVLFLAIGGISLVVSTLEMGLLIWSGMIWSPPHGIPQTNPPAADMMGDELGQLCCCGAKFVHASAPCSAYCTVSTRGIVPTHDDGYSMLMHAHVAEKSQRVRAASDRRSSNHLRILAATTVHSCQCCAFNRNSRTIGHVYSFSHSSVTLIYKSYHRKEPV